jgi:hypothetical protein
MRPTAHKAFTAAILVLLAAGTFLAQAHNSWVDWSEDATQGQLCGSGAQPYQSVTRSKQWYVYFRNTCWNGGVVTFASAAPNQSASGQCIGADTGCYPTFQAYSSSAGSTLWWNGHATSQTYLALGVCQNATEDIFPLSAQGHTPYDPPCPNPPCQGDGTPCTHESQCCSGLCGIEARICGDPTPIVINRTGRPRLSSAAEGVLFNFWGNGTPFQIPWPADSDTAWLVLDINGNGVIDDGSELFGNRTQLSNGRFAAHGYEALAELDANRDGIVNDSDPVYARLALWHDFQRDGVSAPGELVPLVADHITALSLDYKESRYQDEWGNTFRYRAPVFVASGRRVFSYDVFFPTDSTDKR